ncbi:thioesterase family protein [Marinagarivorans algicola]|uniref:thioesterase family protein n=1 Tax=Marinagarivorans algicola TaxID=1513270 RepID=UPI0006B48948|nr:thioesterase family protein [Marinagarivorans algicola]
MYLIFRMLYVLLVSRGKPRLPIEQPSSTLTFRVLPNDIDINMHMNNGRYLTICDLSRLDIFIRSGLAKTMIQNKWMPVISEHTMRYKRSLGLFQKYHISTKIIDWNEKTFHMEHTFTSVLSGRVVAEGISKGCVVHKGVVIPPLEVMNVVTQRLKNKV